MTEQQINDFLLFRLDSKEFEEHSNYNDHLCQTVGEYFHILNKKLWREEESFSGKSPFGNSGWQHEILHAAAMSGILETVVFDDDGYIEEMEAKEFENMLSEVFAYVFKVRQNY